MTTPKNYISGMGTGKYMPGKPTPMASLEDETRVIPPHPLGVKPAGNAFSAVENAKVMAGLFLSLSDELILQVLEFLDHWSLLRLGATCKLFYAFCRFDDLWKTLFIEYVFLLFIFLLFFLPVFVADSKSLVGLRYVLTSEGLWNIL